MKRLFRSFDHNDTVRWFENEGVRLVLQEDYCFFPASQDAMQIVRTLLSGMRLAGVSLHTRRRVSRVSRLSDGRFSLDFSAVSVPSAHSAAAADERPDALFPGVRNGLEFDVVVVTTGGSPKVSGLGMIDGLGLEIVPPVPSLFTFNLPGSPVRELMGAVVENVSASLAGTKFKASGPLLVTHWGMSGPAILKLSSYAARYLADNEYSATLCVNWFGELDEQSVRNVLAGMSSANSRKLILNTHPADLPARLWEYLAQKCGIREDARWAELGVKGMNRLVNTLTNDEYRVCGKSRFKEEFVTCGGVALSNVNPNTLESKAHPGLYFAGEVLDVDAITGGFNLQAAWTMGYTVARAIADRYASR